MLNPGPCGWKVEMLPLHRPRGLRKLVKALEIQKVKEMSGNNLDFLALTSSKKNIDSF